MSFFSNVFLCYDNSKDYDLNQRHSFKCREFKDFLEADLYYRNRICNDGNKDTTLGLHTMVSVPMLLPRFIKNYILHYKISNIFVITEISK